MAYEFDKVIERRGTNSLKYDFATERGKPEGLLPMWVADMDFAAPAEVLEDLKSVLTHGVFGYTEVKDDYYHVLIQWFSLRFGFHFTRRDVVKTPGVVLALALMIRAFTNPGDGVMIQTPGYYPFSEMIRGNGRVTVTNPLLYQDGQYTIDFEDFERKIIEKNITLFILCSPHNPVGRVWIWAELARMNEILQKHRVAVFSDEIHCDFIYPGHTHTCFGLLNEDAVIATAPSKTFNLAGLQIANIIMKNTDMRHLFKAEFVKTGYSQLNTMGLKACQSVYTHGGPWLAQLLEYLAGNVEAANTFITLYLPKVRMVQPQGTYLMWLDFSAYGLSQEELDRRVTEGAGLWLDGGTMFGKEGEGFERINLACPRQTLMTALRRLEAEFK